MRGGRSAFSPYRFLQRKNYWDAAEAGYGHVAEVVYVGPEAGLSVEALVEKAVGLVQRGSGRSAALRP